MAKYIDMEANVMASLCAEVGEKPKGKKKESEVKKDERKDD